MEWLQYIVAKIIAGLMAVWFALVGAPALPPGHYQGYVEAEFVRVGAPESGTLDHLSVARGDRVRQGEPLFILEHTQEMASRDAAAAKLAAAESDLANLTKGRRPQEIDVIVAQKQQALADLDYSKRELGRLKKLAETQVAAQSRLDQAQAAFDRNKARVDELTAAIATARLAARSDEIRAAQAAVASARADLDEAEWRLSRRSVNAPAGATVDDTLYREGEFVPAGSPVVSLLPPENIKLRFFVRETELGSLRVGERVAFGCDSCAEGLHATVSFIAPQAEFTPPVIYSEQTRAKLVYMVEARPENAAALHPGQPVDVSLEP